MLKKRFSILSECIDIGLRASTSYLWFVIGMMVDIGRGICVGIYNTSNPFLLVLGCHSSAGLIDRLSARARSLGSPKHSPQNHRNIAQTARKRNAKLERRCVKLVTMFVSRVLALALIETRKRLR